MRKLSTFFNSKRRKYIYRVSTALLVVAGGYGILSDTEISLWTMFIGAALVTSMADANTNNGKDGE